MRQGGGYMCGERACSCDDRTRGEDPAASTPLQCRRPPLNKPALRNEEACRDTPSEDREEGWIGDGCVVRRGMWARALVCSVRYFHSTRTANLEESVIYK